MLNRRRLIQALAALGGAGLAAPASARPAAAADFAAAVSRQPLLTPFRGVTDTTGERFTERLATRGRWPEELVGRFYRNGPALYERNGERYHHWFDGDGMVQQFTLAGGHRSGHVTHRGRLVRTAKLQSEARAGRFLMTAFGTAIPGGVPGTGPDSFNPANTNALEHAGRVLAMWEGGSAYGLDPKDLSTEGPVVWRPDLAQVPFSAHPKVDPQGHLWNIGTSAKRIVAWHIDPQGALASVQVGDLPYAGGMVHDMAVTRRYLVVPLPPVSLNFSAPVADGPRRFALQAGEPLRVLVMDKADIGQQRVFELPPQAVFHVGNAHETADGEVVLSYVGAPDAWFLDVGAVALMKGEVATGGASSTCIARLDMATGRASTQSLGDTVEFPRIDPLRIGLPARWLLSAASWTEEHRGSDALLHGLQLRDTQGGAVRRFDYGAHVVVEEHVMVPKPGQRGELDAWLLGSTFDSRAQATVLNLLDAAHIEDGPIAQATLPYVLPLGFHGNFTAA